MQVANQATTLETKAQAWTLEAKAEAEVWALEVDTTIAGFEVEAGSQNLLSLIETQQRYINHWKTWIKNILMINQLNGVK